MILCIILSVTIIIHYAMLSKFIWIELGTWLCVRLNRDLCHNTHTDIGRTNVMHKMFANIGTTCTCIRGKCRNYQHEY